MTDKSKAIVRTLPKTMVYNRAKVGKSVSVVDLKPAAESVNYLLGRGNQLIPSHKVDIPSGSSLPDTHGFTTYTTIYRIAPGYQAIDRLWGFQFFSLSSGILEISVSGSHLNPTKIYPLTSGETLNLYRESVNSVQCDVSGTQEVRIFFKVSASAGGGMYPSNVACFEVPRPYMHPLSQSQEGGVDEESFNRGYPIFDTGQSQYQSIPGLARNVLLAEKQVRRAGLFAWSVPLDTSGNEFDTYAIKVTGAIGGGTDFVQKLKFPVLTKPTYQGVTSSNTLLMWIARVSDFRLGGTMKFENGLGDSVEYHITGSSAQFLETWYSASLPIPMVNPDNNRGLPTGSVGAPGFVPYVTMSMKIVNSESPSQQFKLYALQAFEPHRDLMLTTASYTA